MLFFKKNSFALAMTLFLGLMMAFVSFTAFYPAFSPKKNKIALLSDSVAIPEFVQIDFPQTKGSRIATAKIAANSFQIKAARVKYALSEDSLNRADVSTVQADLTAMNGGEMEGKSILKKIQGGDLVYAQWTATYETSERKEATISSKIQSFEVPKAWVIATIGDSNASGEGNPLVQNPDTATVVWGEGAEQADCRLCHRSNLAGPTQGVERLRADGWAVRYVSFACSGAYITMIDGKGNQLMKPYKPYHDIETAGMGMAEKRVFKKLSQIEMVKEWLGEDELDVLLLSVGGNDGGFLQVVSKCFIGVTPFGKRCFKKGKLEKKVADNFKRIEQLWGDLDTVIRRELKPKKVVITTYADAGKDENGKFCHEYIDPNYDCPKKGSITSGCKLMSKLRDKDNEWMYQTMLEPLNNSIRTAAKNNKWLLIDGLAQSDTTGICSTNPWFRSIAESMHTQGDRKGALHMNGKGHEIFGKLVYAELLKMVGL